MDKKKAVGIWIRVSTEDQARGESPEHHEKRARLYAEAKGWEVRTVYHLEAVSGKAVMQHPEAKRMLEDIKNGKVTGLIFSKLARLARNTRELLDFSDIFRAQDADLISLSESIDTSSSAGRLFYTMIAAMAQWEREEIADRVAASVPIRAKLGKPIGGQAPFGYRWMGKELVIDQHESPIRKLLYELFVVHKRKKVVARMLNEKGYRTRNGSAFSDTTIDRLIRDPIAKGLRRANYTKSLGDKKHWVLKPEKDWVMFPCPPIVTEELWNQCNQILISQFANRKPISKQTVHIFAGILFCHCRGKMYVPSRTKKYVCNSCKKTNISISDIEEIYFEQLKSFLLTKNDLATFLRRANEAISAKEIELGNLQKQKEKIKKEMDKLIELHSKGELPTEGFGSYYKPLETQLKQVENTLIETESNLDYLKVQQLNGDHILENAETLYDRWPSLEPEAKRQIVEELTESIVLGDEEIKITFCYTPSVLQNSPKGQRNVKVALIR